MKIYTRTGDTGQTSLIGGERVSKADIRLETYGTIDELSAAIGLAISLLSKDEKIIKELLLTIQHHLLDVGAELANFSIKPARAMMVPQVTNQKVAWLERLIDRHDANLPPLKNFILPGGSQAASSLHLARTIGRRAERRVVELANNPPANKKINPELIKYLNRLSDLLFVLARADNAKVGAPDIIWQKEKGIKEKGAYER